MLKVVILLVRKDGITRDAFRDWLLGGHAALTRQLPGLRRLVVNLVENEDAPYDAVSEVWFDGRRAFDAAYASEIGRAVAADSQAHLGARVRLYVDELPQAVAAGEPG